MDRVWILVPICILVAGCRANEDSIQTFISHAHETAQTQVAPLPEEYVFVADEFVMTSPRVPFLRPRPEPADTAPAVDSQCWQPDLKRVRDGLESYPLAQLSIKGIIGDNKQLWALISTPEGQLVKVGAGDYLGLNYGQVQQVSRQGIKVEEILPDGAGCWQKSLMALMLPSSDSAV